MMADADAKTTKTTADLLIAAQRHVEQLINIGIVDGEQLVFTIVAREDRKRIAPALKANGLSNREIARTLGVSPQTIGRELAVPNGTPIVPDGTPNKPEPMSEAHRAAREAADVEYEKRETLLRLAEGAYRSAGAFAVPQVRAELTDRLADRKFRNMLAERLRLGVDGAPTIKEMVSGARELAAILEGVKS